MYDQNYALVIATQPKKWNLKYVYTGRLSFNFSFTFTKQFWSGSKHFMITKCVDKCYILRGRVEEPEESWEERGE